MNKCYKCFVIKQYHVPAKTTLNTQRCNQICFTYLNSKVKPSEITDGGIKNPTLNYPSAPHSQRHAVQTDQQQNNKGNAPIPKHSQSLMDSSVSHPLTPSSLLYNILLLRLLMAGPIDIPPMAIVTKTIYSQAIAVAEPRPMIKPLGHGIH